MLFKREHINKMKRGFKWQTRRPVKEGEWNTVDRDTGRIKAVYTATNRKKWEVGKVYAAQPARGKKAEGKFRILNIRQEHLRSIAVDDMQAEGVLLFTCNVCGGDYYHGAGIRCLRCDRGVDVDASLMEWRKVWEALNCDHPYRWIDNPLVWVIVFEWLGEVEK